MKLETYKTIVERIRSNRDVTLEQLSEEFQISKNIARAIYGQEYQRKMKAVHSTHYQEQRMNMYYTRFEEMKTQKNLNCILELAKEYDLSPALLAKILITKYLQSRNEDSEASVSRQMVSCWMKDPSLIPDGFLSYQVTLATYSDLYYGSYTDVIRRCVGQEFEDRLRGHLVKNNIAFMSEDELRANDYDKTPDFKLLIPIGVKGRVINWIESKALFGDPDSHAQYLKEQLWCYWNRYGPGMVIYWFDFVEELNIYEEKGIVVMNDFPGEFTTLSQLLDST